MRSSTLTGGLCCFLLACIPAVVEDEPSSGDTNNGRLITGTAAKLPLYTASKAESMLQPLPEYPEGLYNDRTNGCCAPRHLGTDFKAPAGTAVRALLPGIILPTPVSGPHCNFGYTVVVWTKFVDDSDVVLVYGHLSGRDTLKPKLSGKVQRGEIIGYVGHSGGDSPSGTRCGTDDENGDGDTHVHIGARRGMPAMNAENELIWAYYGYAGAGEDVDIDISGVERNGKFTDVIKLANCWGTHAGLVGEHDWLPGISDGIHQRYCDQGGFKELGHSHDAGRGNRLAFWDGAYCQTFVSDSGTYSGENALCWNGGDSLAYRSVPAIWRTIKQIGGLGELGVPLSDAQEVGIGFLQRFRNGRIAANASEALVYINDVLRYHFGGDDTTEPPDDTNPPVEDRCADIDLTSDPQNCGACERKCLDGDSCVNSRCSRTPPPEESPPPAEEPPPADDTDTQLPDETSCRAAPPELINDGSFGLVPLFCGWYLEDHYNGARLVHTCDPQIGCYVELWTDILGDIFGAQFETLVPIVSGARYRLTFWAKASASDTFQVQLMKHTEPWTNMGLFDWTLATNFWREYQHEFMANTDDPNARLTFMFGSRSTHLFLDHVSLIRLE